MRIGIATGEQTYIRPRAHPSAISETDEVRGFSQGKFEIIHGRKFAHLELTQERNGWWRILMRPVDEDFNEEEFCREHKWEKA